MLEANSFHYAAFVDRDGAERGASVVRNRGAQGVYQFAGAKLTSLISLVDSTRSLSAWPKLTM